MNQTTKYIYYIYFSKKIFYFYSYIRLPDLRYILYAEMGIRLFQENGSHHWLYVSKYESKTNDIFGIVTKSYYEYIQEYLPIYLSFYIQVYPPINLFSIQVYLNNYLSYIQVYILLSIYLLFKYITFYLSIFYSIMFIYLSIIYPAIYLSTWKAAARTSWGATLPPVATTLSATINTFSISRDIMLYLNTK